MDITAFARLVTRQLKIEQRAIQRLLDAQTEIDHVERCQLEQAIRDHMHCVDLIWALHDGEVADEAEA